jgi:hypothetical protein
VCAAAAAARTGEQAIAQREFDNIHTGLHELAAAAEGEDRTVAGALLRAKQRVEAERPTPSPANLDALADEVRAAIRVTGGRATVSCR